jgi:hypothetical protein
MLSDSDLSRVDYDGVHVTERDYIALKALFGEYVLPPSKGELKAAHMDEIFYSARGSYGDKPELAARAVLKKQGELDGIESRIIDESPEALNDIFIST